MATAEVKTPKKKHVFFLSCNFQPVSDLTITETLSTLRWSNLNTQFIFYG